MSRISLSLLCALFVAACGGGGDGTALQQAAAVTQTIGAAGGTIAGPNGVTLSIPAGALSADTAITIAVDDAGAPSLPADATRVGLAYSITPHGTSFGVPVQLSVPLDPTLLPAGESPLLLKTRGNSWHQLVAERDGNTLTAAITELSYVIGVRCCIESRLRFLDEPDDQTAPEGGFAFFRGEAIGDNRFLRYQWLRNGFPLFGETNPEILIPHVTLAHDNSLYALRVTQAGGFSIESRAARLLVQPIPPAIVNEPVDAQVVEGLLARFSAASASSAPQTLQWQVRRRDDPGFTDLDTQTATALSFAAQAGDDGALFRMCAANVAGMTCSRGARLSVIPQPLPPVITQQPQPVTTAAGNTASFSVHATGGSLSYAWQTSRGGGNFAPEPTCADSATCALSNTQLGDDGLSFRVLVSNSAGSALSADALLTVRLNPGAALARVLGGNQHAIALRANGTLRAWGANNDGQLGDGTFDVRDDAVDIPGLTDVATFALGDDHAIALRANGEVWTWGDNDRGQLGDGSTTARATPQRIAGIGPARAAAANLFAMARSTVVLTDGSVWSWGSNLNGQLGDGTTTARLTPVRAGTLSNVVRVTAGLGFTLALRDDGTVWAWGDNRGGQLGDGTSTASLVPIPIPMPASIAAIAAGSTNSLALTADGAVYAWGLNAAGEVGDGTRERRLSPTPVSLPAPAVAIAAGGNHMLALLLDGRVFAWGSNFDGQSGNGTADEYQPTPQQVVAPLPASITAIGVGLNHSLALAADGSVWAWGNNFSGQLNDGTRMTERAVPVPVRNVNLN